MNEKLVIFPTEANKDIWNALNKFIRNFSELAIKADILEIYIGGGFGREEGSVIYKDGLYVTSNDYDMFAIYDDRETNKIVPLIEGYKKIKREKRFQNFDMEFIPAQKIATYGKRQWLSQSIFDFLKGCICIWKNTNLMDQVNSLDNLMDKCKKNIYRIHKFSAYDVLRTRLWCVVSPMEFSNTMICFDQTYKNHTFRCFQLIKACTAIIDAVLILENKYESTKFLDKTKIFLNTNFAKQYPNECNIVSEIVRSKIKNEINYDLYDGEVEKIVSIYTITIDYCKKNRWYICYTLFTNLYKVYAILNNRPYNENLNLSVNRKIKKFNVYYSVLNQMRIGLRKKYEEAGDVYS